MKKLIVCVGLVLAVALCGSTAGLAVDICLDNMAYCNDYFLSAVKERTSPVYRCHGYEYDCGYDDRIVTGSVHVVGDYAYFGLTINTSGFDCGALGFQTIVIDLTTWTGTGMWNYVYFSGGVLSGHPGGPADFIMSYCSAPQVTSAATEPDNAVE